MNDKIYKLLRESVKIGKEVWCNDIHFINEITYILNYFDIKIFLETGSYLGYSSDFIKKLFPEIEIYSCDIVKEYIQKAIINNNSINYEVNDSYSFLEDKLKIVGNKLPFIFSDAHQMFGIGTHPLREELEIIAKSNISAIICIHDCEVPTSTKFGFNNLIRINIIKGTLNNINSNYKVYIPSLIYDYHNLRGRCYVLINPDTGMLSGMNNELFLLI
jgi:hypothetical protein